VREGSLCVGASDQVGRNATPGAVAAALEGFATDARALRGGKFVAVDSDPHGAALTLSHHFGGNATPGPFRDDLAAGAALRWAASPERVEWLRGARVVYNDHFDVDGFLAAWVALHPDEALAMEREVRDAAAAGDFEEWTSDRAVKFAVLGEWIDDPKFSGVAREALALKGAGNQDALYGAVLRELPELLRHPERLEEVWARPFSQLRRELAVVDGNKARVVERPLQHLSMLAAPRLLSSRAVVARTKGDRLLQAAKVDGGFMYLFRYRPYLGYRIVSREVTAAHDPEDLARELNRRWPAKGETWRARGWWERELRLYGPSLGRNRLPQTPPEAALPIFEEALAALDAKAQGSGAVG
jgi:hypothetical protein